jgi:hypothetical protein
MKQYIIIACCLLGISGTAQELDVKKTWVSGHARSILLTDTYDARGLNDTVTANALMSGHTLLDLAANIQPTENIFIQGKIRIRNDHGGFWDSGVTFDVRNLYLRGVIGNAFRYQLGDVNYKLTEYTFFNPDEELSQNEQLAFMWMREMNRYDLFYDENNTWRQQGVTGEFGLKFKKNIESMDFNMFTMRLNTFETAAFEQLYTGARVSLKQSDMFDFHGNYVHAFDLIGTSANTDRYDNSVITGGFGVHKDISDWKGHIHSEFGISNEEKILQTDTLTKEDYFSDIEFKLENKDSKMQFTLGYNEVGPQFRSIGAQTRRLNVNAQPRAFSRIGNTQELRSLGMLDIIRDASLYNTRLNNSLMAFNPSYGNFRPYGKATPNRRAMSVTADFKELVDFIDVGVNLISASEVIGSGTADLKQFMVMSGQTNIHIGQLLETERQIDLIVGYSSESTTRSGDSDFESIDLSNTVLDLATEIGIVDGLKFVAAYRTLESEGNELERRENQIGELIGFTTYDVSFKEDLSALGLRYDFNENAMLNFQYSRYLYNDNRGIQQPYALNDLSIIYRIKF